MSPPLDPENSPPARLSTASRAGGALLVVALAIGSWLAPLPVMALLLGGLIAVALADPLRRALGARNERRVPIFVTLAVVLIPLGAIGFQQHVVELAMLRARWPHYVASVRAVLSAKAGEPFDATSQPAATALSVDPGVDPYALGMLMALGAAVGFAFMPTIRGPGGLRVAATDWLTRRLPVGVLIAAVCGTGWALVGVPFALLLAEWVAVLSLAGAGVVLVLPVALLSAYFAVGGEGWVTITLSTFAIFAFAQIVDVFVLPATWRTAPPIPAAVFALGLLIAAALLGAPGVLLWVLVAATLPAFRQNLRAARSRPGSAVAASSAPPASSR